MLCYSQKLKVRSAEALNSATSTTCLSSVLSFAEGGVYKRLTYGMIHREKDHRVRPSKPIPTFLSSTFPAAIGPLSCDFLLLLAKRVTINHLLFSSCLCCFTSIPVPLASMGTEVNSTQQDPWLFQCFFSVTTLMHVQQNAFSMQQ